MFRKMAVALAAGLMVGTCFASWPTTSETLTFHVSMGSSEFQRQVSDANSEINRVLATYGTGGLSVTPYRLTGPNQAIATVYDPTYGSTLTVTVINDGGGSPSASRTITAGQVLRNSALDLAAPGKDSQHRRKVTPSGFRADIFYNTWEAGDGDAKVEGYTAGVTPTIMFGGEVFEFSLAIPIHGSVVEESDMVAHVGADLALRIWLCDYFSIGGHGSYVADIIPAEGESEADVTGSFNGGPFASVRIPMGRVGVLSFAVLYERLIPDEGDAVSELAFAANVGFNLGDSAALNVYGIQHKNTDSELSDMDYNEVGSELQFGGGTWAFTIGAKTTLNIEDYTSIEGYIGSEWRW